MGDCLQEQVELTDLSCLCGSTGYRLVLCLETPYKMIECQSCGLRRTFPFLSGVTGSARWRSDNVEREPECDSTSDVSKDRKQQIAYVKAMEVKRFVPSGRLLEIGCSAGRLSVIAAKNGLHAVGMDMVSSPFRTSSSKAHSFLAADVSNMPFKALAVEAVTLHHTLEHVENPVECLNNIFLALKPGGFLFLSVPNHKALIPRLIKASWPGYIPWSHRWHFSPKTLLSLVKQSGFRIVRRTRHESMDTPNMGARAKYFVYWVLNLVQTLVGMGDNICLVARRD